MTNKQVRSRIYCDFCEREFLGAFDREGYARCPVCGVETLNIAIFRSRYPHVDLWKTIWERCGRPCLDKIFFGLSDTDNPDLELEFLETGENAASILTQISKGLVCFCNLDEHVDVLVIAKIYSVPQKWVTVLAQANVLPVKLVDGKHTIRIGDILDILLFEFDAGGSRSDLLNAGRDLVRAAAKIQSLRMGDLPMIGLQDSLICLDRMIIANYRIREAKLTGAIQGNVPLNPVPYFSADARLHITRVVRNRADWDVIPYDELAISLDLGVVDPSVALLLFAVLDHVDEDGKFEYDYSAFILENNEVKRYFASKDVLPDMLKKMQDDDGGLEIPEEVREQFERDPQKFVSESYLDVVPIMMASNPESAPRNFPAALAQIASVVNEMLADGTCPEEWVPWEDYLKNFVALSTKQSGE